MIRFFLVFFSFLALTQTVSADGVDFCRYMKHSEKMEAARMTTMQRMGKALADPTSAARRKRAVKKIEKELSSFTSRLRDFEARTQPFADGEFSKLRTLQLQMYTFNLDYIQSTLTVLKADEDALYEADLEQYDQRAQRFELLIVRVEQEMDRLFTAYPYPCGVRLTTSSFIRVIVPGILVVGFVVWWGFLRGPA